MQVRFNPPHTDEQIQVDIRKLLYILAVAEAQQSTFRRARDLLQQFEEDRVDRRS